jgi:hypothetical protein
LDCVIYAVLFCPRKKIVSGVISDANGPIPGANAFNKATTGRLKLILMESILLLQNQASSRSFLCGYENTSAS